MKKLIIYFILDWGTYRGTTLIVVGRNFKQIEKTYQKLTKRNEKDLQSLISKKSKGFFWCKCFPSGKVRRTEKFWLKGWKSNWRDSKRTEALIHELFHIIYQKRVKPSPKQ